MLIPTVPAKEFEKFGFMSINTLKIEDRNLKRKQPSNKGANDYIFVAK